MKVCVMLNDEPNGTPACAGVTALIEKNFIITIVMPAKAGIPFVFMLKCTCNRSLDVYA